MGNLANGHLRDAKPPADTWKPVGGCKFTGYCRGIVGNSALRFCLLLRWQAAYQPASDLFYDQVQGDSLSCCPADGTNDDLESVGTPSSNNSDNRARHRPSCRASSGMQGQCSSPE